LAEPGWYLLIHQLPPRPLYLRARIRQRLDRVGALALKNSVYVLPQAPSCLEDFQWIAQEAVAGGGEAFVCAAAFVAGLDDAEIAERFRQARAADYAALIAEARAALAALRGRTAVPDPRALPRLRRRLQEVSAIDFFASGQRAQAEAAVRALEARLRPEASSGGGARASSPRRRQASLVGKTWVTRRNVHVDRIATAWLIRTFVDPAARFRFVDAQETPPREGEVRFDMVGGEFTHRGDRCTFEELAQQLGLADPAVATLAEIVHDIDLKDGKFARPEAPGVEQLVNGICRSSASDEERLERGFQLFADLYLASSKPRRRARVQSASDS
jgi:hypothetical protein